MDQDPKAMIAGVLQPWHAAVADPASAQEAVLHRLLQIHGATDYGARHGAAQIETLADFRRAFPVMTYEMYKPLIQRVIEMSRNLPKLGPIQPVDQKEDAQQE